MLNSYFGFTDLYPDGGGKWLFTFITSKDKDMYI